MRLRQTTLSPLLRSLAALALTAFVVAQSMCFVHCHFGGGHADEAQPSCHGSPKRAVSHDGDDSSAPSTPSPATACSTLKTMILGSDAPILAAFQAHTLYRLASVVLSLEAGETQAKAAFVCRDHSHEWTFTPEVCLGPAFRSLAPPFLG